VESLIASVELGLHRRCCTMQTDKIEFRNYLNMKYKAMRANKTMRIGMIANGRIFINAT